MDYSHFIVISVFFLLVKYVHNKVQETAQKVFASALVVIGNVFHKILNTHKGFLTEKTH